MTRLLTAALLAAATFTSANPTAAAPQGPDLASEVRTSVRWLRSMQDVESGAYEGSVEATALAVIAFAECPDHYRAVDGPFVRKALDYLAAQQREDGSIGAKDASADSLARTTALALTALRLGAGGHDEVRARASEWLGAHGGVPPEKYPFGLELEPLPQDAAAGEKLAAELLKERDPAGFWLGPRGRVVETSARAIVLSHLHALRTSAAGESKPAPEIAALPKFSPADRAAALKSIQKGAQFLARLADDKGRFGASGKPDAGLTAMALAGLQAVPEPRSEALQKTIDAGLAWLASLQHEDGSIHDGKLANYITSASIQALARSGKDEYAPAIAKAAAFLRRLQNDEGEGYSEGDLYYGGIGYGSTERPDLSNLQMALEALHAAGGGENSETYAKALRFLQRTQNRSESSDVKIEREGKVIRSGDDGGAAYAPGDSKAGVVTLSDGSNVPRSYGSMTYALLKCYIFAGLPADDPRLKAAFEWCERNYTLDVNPGFDVSVDPAAAYQGLFYYFLTLAKALDAAQVESLKTPDGAEHAWRTELCGRLAAMQSKTDGSWTNHNSPRWYEGNPLLATAYALLALEAALPPQAGSH
jgi:squalene-hopene/tetraprenyl-beta-curcumene cyclase